jgi:poly [ADP-ribose] polymerase
VLEKQSTQSLEDLSSGFYTQIPHSFGMIRMSNFIIDTKEKLKQKMDLIQNLSDIKIAHKIIKDEQKDRANKSEINSFDSNYS